MDLATIALLIGVAGFGGFGIWLLAVPGAMGAVDIPADSPNARVEIRAMYGIGEIGIAVFLILCIGDPTHEKIALMFQLLTLGGIALGRLVGIALEKGRVKGLLWFLFAVEAAATVFTGAAALSFHQ